MRSTYKRLLLTILLFSLIFTGCEALKASRPIIPLKEYEKLIAGRIDAQYVGTERCLSACHSHDKIRRDFEASTMGAQLSRKSGMPIVDCESCHGPGSLAIEGITPEKVEEDKKKGIDTKCKYETLIDFKKLPPPALSLICLKCHTANATFNLHKWNASQHAINDVSCSDCHRIHAGPDLIVSPKETAQMCYKCHINIRAEFSLPSHHPVHEMKIFCTDCHNSHGDVPYKLLRRDTRELCTQCHADKEGPFVYEHADLMDNCLNCHVPHGSVNNNLLQAKEPFLCLQCHEGHRVLSGSDLERKVTFYGRCTDCHVRIHGTDIPSQSGKGRFVQ
ncbi:MAG: DmsE family decaheme c-type cytochrome [Thermodesulfovibrionales bacterium]|nr:DmsE family decaheme c-type cytochrome [Thermodesulfovibrionales bacterium]